MLSEFKIIKLQPSTQFLSGKYEFMIT